MAELPFLEQQPRPPKSRISALATVALTLSLKSAQAGVVTLSDATTGLGLRVDEARGAYHVTWSNTAWELQGSVGAPIKDAAASHGQDAVGAFQQVTFAWQNERSPMTGQIRIYHKKPVMFFSATCQKALEMAPAPFPAFTRMPSDLHIYSHSLKEFGPPQFNANEISTPWLLFDDKANALILSPASNFMVASMQGDGRQKVGVGFNRDLRNVPAGYTQSALLAFGNGINRAWDAWGDALLDLNGTRHQRPANDTGVILKYLGYWTDNGSTYYYHYDAEKGYAGTLKDLVARYRKEQIPIRYLQLDSWWYSKSTTGADGKPGKAKKIESLPEGEWNRYGGTIEYKAHKALFPDGLDAFQRSIGMPLITHARWIDPGSPYHQKYKMSGLASIDPKWWDEIAAYLKTSGVAVYEQDWLDRIFSYSPSFSADPAAAETFLNEMARACAGQGIDMQYCMPYAAHFMQGSRYTNLTTIRTCTDRFNPKRWNDFLYTSRLASSLGIWPWADVYFSTEEPNVLLSTLSAGPVGIGDAIGRETMTNLSKAVRADGVIVKPDSPAVPTDQSYINDACETTAPLVVSTRTSHSDLCTEYVFAFNRPKAPSSEVKFTPADFGFCGPVYVHDFFAGSGKRLEAAGAFDSRLKRATNCFYVIAPVGRSGIAFLGDRDKFVGTGRQRIAALDDQPRKLSVDVVLAEMEKGVTLHGYATAAPRVSANSGRAGDIQYNAATGYFTAAVQADLAIQPRMVNGDPVRRMTVTFETPGS